MSATTSGISRTMGVNEWLILLLLGVIWGGSFIFVELLVEVWPPFTIVLLRCFIAALGLWSYILIRGQSIPLGWALWGNLCVMGFLNNVLPFSLFFWAQETITASLASILNATTPLFTILFAHFLTQDEKMSLGRLLGVVVGILGVSIMIGIDALSYASDGSLLPQLAVLGTATCYALSTIFGRRFRTMNITPSQTAAGQMTAASVLILPAVLIIDDPISLPLGSLYDWLYVMALALVCTAFAYILYFRILNSSGATNITLVTFLVPIFAILLGITLLGEVLELKHLIGMGMIGSGIALIDGRPIRAIKSRFSPSP